MSVIFFEKAHPDLGSSRWPKELRSANGTEFTKDLLTEFCREHGITGNFTLLYSSYQNGTAERMNRTVLEKTRALLSQGLVPAALWSDAVRYAAFLINWTPSLVLSYDAPVDVWHGRKLPRPKFHAFGCMAVVQLPEQDCSKVHTN